VRFAVVTFPGSNCDRDCVHVLRDVMSQEVREVWHKESALPDVDCVVLPGGFSYGDYLRCGAIARFSPVMTAIEAFARRGGLVLGICNGFQILQEAGLLPGALLRNLSLTFICQDVRLRVERHDTKLTSAVPQGKALMVPIAHNDGGFFASGADLDRIEGEGLVLLRYCDPAGNVTAESNPNGSCRNIAGVRNAAGNVLGLMPHPERCSEKALGNEDGLLLLRSLLGKVAG